MNQMHFLHFLASLFEEHNFLYFLEKLFFEACIFFDKKEAFFFEFFCLFGFELELLFVVSWLLNKEEFVFVQINASLLFHDLLVDVLVSFLSEHEIVSHFFEYFAEGDQKIGFYLFDVHISELAVMFESLLDGAIKSFKVLNELLMGI